MDTYFANSPDLLKRIFSITAKFYKETEEADIALFESGELYSIFCVTPILLYQFYPLGAMLVASFWILHFSNQKKYFSLKSIRIALTSVFTLKSVYFTNASLLIHGLWRFPAALFYDEVSILGGIFSLLMGGITLGLFWTCSKGFDEVARQIKNKKRTLIYFMVTYNALQLFVIFWASGRTFYDLSAFFRAFLIIFEYMIIAAAVSIIVVLVMCSRNLLVSVG